MSFQFTSAKELLNISDKKNEQIFNNLLYILDTKLCNEASKGEYFIIHDKFPDVYKDKIINLLTLAGYKVEEWNINKIKISWINL